MRPRQKRVRPTSGRRRWAIAGIAAFLLIDIALVAWAFTATHSTDGGTPGPIPTFSKVPATTRPTPTSAPAPAAVAAPRLLAAVSATVAYRASAGACPPADADDSAPTDAVLERTADGGATWQKLDTSRYDMHTLASLFNVGDARATVVSGAGDDCAPQLFDSFTGGKFWEKADGIDDAAYIDPSDRSVIHVAGASEPAPCPAALQLAQSGDTTAVLCADGLHLRTGSGDWATVPTTGVLSVAATDAGYTLAVSGVQDCAGVAIETIPAADATASPSVVGCAASVTPDQVTVAQAGNAVWLWSGATTTVSSDGGASWS